MGWLLIFWNKFHDVAYLAIEKLAKLVNVARYSAVPLLVDHLGKGSAIDPRGIRQFADGHSLTSRKLLLSKQLHYPKSNHCV